jgi:hypothetical protein
VAVERSEMAAQLTQVKKAIDAAQKMIGRNASIKIMLLMQVFHSSQTPIGKGWR